ncbi:MAG: BMC domain-containing protein [Eubacteriaceae bacterium]|uniref:BMC domain-containing protein n=2 Tax=Pseudoramibacter TaxID=113286 RepID=A0A6L5GV61_9FIRM|nr:BMC domain-containing protein [Pseudoramibacter porci]MQM73660.1 BMC domain-containing protein [Candidatus Pseudoramibacter fermentans]MSS20398.1 BMC domain-containing protein [Pseudoramibacter porci]RRF92746.1 MAG: BMC domain-containing protein [Eubacteriaceae bacterium]
MKNAIGFIEFKSIPIGIESTDQMLKSGNVELVTATPICPGKYVTIISGDVGAVRSSVKNGEVVGGMFVIESHVIPNIHQAVFPALMANVDVDNVQSIGIIETINAISSIVVADTAVKAANITLVEVRMARGLGGKAFVIMTGEVSPVKQAVKAAENAMREYGVITSTSVIASPHQDVRKLIL